MDENLKELLVAGAMFVGSLIWAYAKSAKEKRRKGTARAASKPLSRTTSWPDYAQTGGQVSSAVRNTAWADASDDYSAATTSVRQQQTAPPPENRRPVETVATASSVAADDAAETAIDSETLRQAVKWSVILEKKF